MKCLRLNLGLLLLARDLLLAELDALQNHLLVADQVVDGHAESVAQGDQHAGTGYILVPFVFADLLGRNPVANSVCEVPQGKTGSGPSELKSFTDHGFVLLASGLQL